MAVGEDAIGNSLMNSSIFVLGTECTGVGDCFKAQQQHREEAGARESLHKTSDTEARYQGDVFFVFLFLIHGFFLALKLEGVRRPKNIPTVST